MRIVFVDHGSKSVTIENITEAYDKASQGNGFSEEFVWSDVERNGMRQYGFLTDNLHTDYMSVWDMVPVNCFPIPIRML